MNYKNDQNLLLKKLNYKKLKISTIKKYITYSTSNWYIFVTSFNTYFYLKNGIKKLINY